MVTLKFEHFIRHKVTKIFIGKLERRTANFPEPLLLSLGKLLDFSIICELNQMSLRLIARKYKYTKYLFKNVSYLCNFSLETNVFLRVKSVKSKYISYYLLVFTNWFKWYFYIPWQINDFLFILFKEVKKECPNSKNL